MVQDTRTTDKFIRNHYILYNYWPVGLPSNPIAYMADSGYLPTLGHFKSIVSERSGSFKKGTFRSNSCLIRDLSVTSKPGYAEFTYNGYVNALIGHLPLRLRFLSGYTLDDYGTWSDNLANYAAVKTLAAARQIDYDFAQDLGELGETLAMLRNPFGFLRSGLREIAKGRKSGLIDILANGWMQYRYGIMPLIYSIQDIIKLVESGFAKKSGLRSLSKGITVETDKNQTYNDSFSPFFTWKGEHKVHSKQTATHHLYYTRNLDTPDITKLRALGMHPEQFIPLMWELTGRSFVVDWFFSVGDWLRAVLPETSISVKGCCTTIKSELDIDSRVKSIYSSYNLDPSKTVLPEYFWHSSILERRNGTPVALPPFNPNFFRYKRLLDSLSMLWGTITRGSIRRH